MSFRKKGLSDILKKNLSNDANMLALIKENRLQLSHDIDCYSCARMDE